MSLVDTAISIALTSAAICLYQGMLEVVGNQWLAVGVGLSAWTLGFMHLPDEETTK